MPDLDLEALHDNAAENLARGYGSVPFASSETTLELLEMIARLRAGGSIPPAITLPSGTTFETHISAAGIKAVLERMPDYALVGTLADPAIRAERDDLRRRVAGAVAGAGVDQLLDSCSHQDGAAECWHASNRDGRDG